MRYLELFEAAEVDFHSMHIDHMGDGSPWYGFVFDLVQGGSLEIFVEVRDESGTPANQALFGVDMHINDILVTGVEGSPHRFETSSHGFGIQLGSISVRVLRRLIGDEVRKTFPDLARVSGFRMTGARRINPQSNANASVRFPASPRP